MTRELDWDSYFDQMSPKENMSQIKLEIINNNFDERFENGISIYKFGWVDDNRYILVVNVIIYIMIITYKCKINNKSISELKNKKK